MATLPSPLLRIVAFFGLSSIERGHVHAITVHPHIGPSDARMLLPQREQTATTKRDCCKSPHSNPNPQVSRIAVRLAPDVFFESL